MRSYQFPPFWKFGTRFNSPQTTEREGVKTLQLSPPYPSPLPGLHQVRLFCYSKYLINLLLLWSDYCKKECIFKANGRFDFAVVCVCILILQLFHSSVILELQIASYLHICIASYLASHQIMWYNKRLYKLLLFFDFQGN